MGKNAVSLVAIAFVALEAVTVPQVEPGRPPVRCYAGVELMRLDIVYPSCDARH